MLIYRKTPAYSRSKAARLLGKADWQEIQRLTPRQATRAPHGLKTPISWRGLVRAAETWSAIFNPGSPGSRHALLLWIVYLLALSLIGQAFLFQLTPHLPDRGWGLARPAGIVAGRMGRLDTRFLALGTVFLCGLIGGVMVLMSAGALAFSLMRGRALLAFLRERSGVLLVEETVFWAAFAAMLWIRWHNPDLWHPQLGGEKPMNLAYLNAVVHAFGFSALQSLVCRRIDEIITTSGYVLIAMPIKLAGIPPEIAYNLAYPHFICNGGERRLQPSPSHLAQPARQAGCGRRLLGTALLGSVLVALAGNLGQWRVIGLALRHYRENARFAPPFDVGGAEPDRP